jgi:hypothetical protein
MADLTCSIAFKISEKNLHAFIISKCVLHTPSITSSKQYLTEFQNKYRACINYSPHSHSTHIAFSFTVDIVPFVDSVQNKEKMS